MSLMPERSTLRVRTRPHIHPDRKSDTIVEVVRSGEIVATIYGSREGVHIVSDLFGERGEHVNPIFVDTRGVAAGSPGVAIPLLRDDEFCPWCGDSQFIGPEAPCPICQRRKR